MRDLVDCRSAVAASLVATETLLCAASGLHYPLTAVARRLTFREPR